MISYEIICTLKLHVMTLAHVHQR